MAISKTINSVKRFGARYGRTSRHIVGKIEHEQRRRQKCPYCRKDKVRRVSAGIWYCESCHSKFTGKAYTSLSDKKQSFIKREVKEEQIDESILNEVSKSEGQKYKEINEESKKDESLEKLHSLDDEYLNDKPSINSRSDNKDYDFKAKED